MLKTSATCPADSCRPHSRLCIWLSKSALLGWAKALALWSWWVSALPKHEWLATYYAVTFAVVVSRTARITRHVWWPSESSCPHTYAACWQSPLGVDRSSLLSHFWALSIPIQPRPDESSVCWRLREGGVDTRGYTFPIAAGCLLL